jgi:CRISPR-associated protein Cas1
VLVLLLELVTVIREILPLYTLRSEASKAQGAKTPRELLNIEAELTKKAWSLLRRHIPQEYGFTGRQPRSHDPVNQAISYTYAILYTLSSHALTAAGLDPHIGLLHTTGGPRKSLAYDHSEQFKPLAIHAAITASRKTTLDTGPDGYLDATSLEVVTKTLYTYLKRKPTGRTLTNRAYIYTKAWELRNTLVKGTKYNPYTYNPR